VTAITAAAAGLPSNPVIAEFVLSRTRR